MSESDVDQELLAQIENHVLWLTLNRPDAGNAITPAVRNRMIEHLADASSELRGARRRAHRGRARSTSARAPTCAPAGVAPAAASPEGDARSHHRRRARA